MRNYHTLAVKPPGEPWSPQFGDYDKDVVTQEQADTKSDWPKGTRFKVLKTGGRQVDINRAIDALNSQETK